jgi:hypothetical protein
MTLDTVTEAVSRRVANASTRKSFLGKVAVFIGVLGTRGLSLPEVAGAASCCGCSTCGYSTTCGGTSCPSGTCNCGAWYLCECSPSLKKYQDCCAACSGGCSCGGDGRPSCYYTAPYGSCSGHKTVKCRVITCTQLAC